MTWRWEYAFGAEESAKNAPGPFLREVEKKADELVRMCEAVHIHGEASRDQDPRGATVPVPGGMITYQVVVRRERVYIVQITALEW